MVDDYSGERMRRLPRSSILLAATITSFGAKSSTTHRIRDLGRGGIRIDNVEPLTLGSTVLVSVGELDEVSARVTWINNGFVGVSFGQEIDVEQARAKAGVAAKKPVLCLGDRLRILTLDTYGF